MLDWAKASGFRNGDNPVSGVSKGLPRQPDRKEHHKALAYQDVPKFIGMLRSSGTSETTCLAFEFLILTAARTGEVLGATWREIDLAHSMWTIPGTRMKTGREHRVPLSARCIEILQRAKELAYGGDYAFPGQWVGKPLSNMALLMTLRRMNVPVTVHGFRSAFRDWAAEQTNFPREVCEMALSHAISDKTEAAYRRGDLFEKRLKLMSAWAEFSTPRPMQVVAFRA